MSARLISTQTLQAVPDVTLTRLPGRDPFASVDLTEDGRTYINVSTPAEAYALRDAFGKAGDLLAEAEGSAT